MRPTSDKDVPAANIAAKLYIQKTQARAVVSDPEARKQDGKDNLTIRIEGGIRIEQTPQAQEPDHSAIDDTPDASNPHWFWNAAIGRVILGIDKHSTTIMALFTLGILFATCNYAQYSKRQWSTMQEQLNLSERPWVSADVSIEPPLVFDTGGASAFVDVLLRNVGHSVAMYVSVWTALRVNGMDHMYEDEAQLCGIPKNPVKQKVIMDMYFSQANK